jgi:DNA-binding transcriptional MerR regulator/DNA-directed RNA polymerase subunit RPC12/RpoP
MSQYTTGELAKAGETSVRTVQFYDEKGLLHPSAFSEGGRRLYDENDLARLRLICLLKSFGISLDSIKGILESEHPEKVLLTLLDEQERQNNEQLKEVKHLQAVIAVVRESIVDGQCGSLEHIGDVQSIMEGKKRLRKDRGILLSVGILMDIAEAFSIVWWVVKGNWVPFAVVMPLACLAAGLLVRFYWNETAYICPECGKKFKPDIWEFLFAKHTVKTRKLTCACCGKKGYCVETYTDEVAK